jgi:hypothetical protein
MMEAANQGCLDDPAFVKALHPSWLWGVLRQGEARGHRGLVDPGEIERGPDAAPLRGSGGAKLDEH